MVITEEMILANMYKKDGEYDVNLDPLILNLPKWKREKRWWVSFGNLLNHLGSHVTFLGKVVVVKKNKYKLGQKNRNLLVG